MRFKKILCVVLAIVMLSTFAIPVAAAEQSSEVYSDLSASLLDGKKFDPSDFPKNTSDTKLYLLTVNERGYNSKDMSKYGFYVYLYNPSGSALNVSSSNNQIELATAWDAKSQIATEYSKFSLEFVSVSEETGYEYVFYKFKVGAEIGGTKTIDKYLDKLGRFYDISGFEVQKMVAVNSSEFTVGMRYAYYGTEAAANKTCKASQIDTIELEVHHTYYRTESSANGVNHQNQLNAVYFNVPKEYWLSYDFLYAIKAYWEEYRTTPMIVTDNIAVAEYLESWCRRTSWEDPNPSNPLSFMSAQTDVHGIVAWSYNVDFSKLPPPLESYYKANKIGWGFFSGDTESQKADVSSQSVLNHWKEHGSSAQSYMITAEGVNEYFTDRVAGPQTHTIRFDQTFSMGSYGSNHNWLQRLWNYNIFNGGAGTNLKDDYSGILAIEEVDTGHVNLRAEDLAKLYFVNPADADNFKAVVDEGKQNGMKTIVFRFAVTDYFAEEVVAMVDNNVVDGTTYRAEQTVFLDFDIISLTFQKEASLYTIPVSSSPSDFIGGIDAPQVDKDGSVGNAIDHIEDLFSEMSAMQMLLRLTGTLMGLALVLFILYLVVGIVKPRSPVIVKINDTAKKMKKASKKNKKNGGST